MLAITRGGFRTWSFALDDYLIEVFVKGHFGICFLTGKDLPKDNAKGIHVGFQSIVFAATHLWGHCWKPTKQTDEDEKTEESIKYPFKTNA